MGLMGNIKGKQGEIWEVILRNLWEHRKTFGIKLCIFKKKGKSIFLHPAPGGRILPEYLRLMQLLIKPQPTIKGKMKSIVEFIYFHL